MANFVAPSAEAKEAMREAILAAPGGKSAPERNGFQKQQGIPKETPHKGASLLVYTATGVRTGRHRSSSRSEKSKPTVVLLRFISSTWMAELPARFASSM